MIGYASRTGTRRNLDALRRAGWRLFISATDISKVPEGFNYAIDNGAWSAFQNAIEWQEELFLKALKHLGDGADFIVVPDIVEGGLKSLDRSRAWLPRLERYRLVLLAVQDGIEPKHVEGLLSPSVGIFLGGSTKYKLETLATWGVVARATGCYYHVGRVNSMRRIYLCAAAGADSFDGTSVSRFAKNIRHLDCARRQTSFVFDDG